MENVNPKLLRALLLTGDVEVTFTKADGTEAVMICTLKLPEEAMKVTDETTKMKKLRAVNPNVQPVWNVEKKAWRSFRYDSVKNVKVI